MPSDFIETATLAPALICAGEHTRWAMLGIGAIDVTVATALEI
jgi:hypothetical protein